MTVLFFTQGCTLLAYKPTQNMANQSTINNSQMSTSPKNTVDTDKVIRISDDNKEFITVTFAHHASAYYLLKNTQNFSQMYADLQKSLKNRKEIHFTIDFDQTKIFPSFKNISFSESD